MAMTEAEFEEMLEAYLAKKQAAKSTRGRKKKKAIAPEPDYDSMDLATYSRHLNDSMSDCTEFAVNELFEMSRANKKGQGLKAASHGIKGAVGAGVVAYGIIELLSVALGGRD